MINTIVIYFQNHQIFISLIKVQEVFTSLIKQHEVITSLIRAHEVFTYLIKLPQVFTSLIKEVLAPEHATMVLSVFLACMVLDNDNLIKI